MNQKRCLESCTEGDFLFVILPLWCSHLVDGEFNIVEIRERFVGFEA